MPKWYLMVRLRTQITINGAIKIRPDVAIRLLFAIRIRNFYDTAINMALIIIIIIIKGHLLQCATNKRAHVHACDN